MKPTFSYLLYYSLQTTTKRSKNKLSSKILLKFVTLLFFSIIVLSGTSQEWLQLGDQIIGTNTGDYLGYHVAMSSDGYTVAAGAYGHDTEFEDAGAARVFTWNGSNWFQKGNDFLGSAIDDELGYSVALSDDGNIVAIGATEDDDSELKTGYAQIYTWSGNTWEQMGETLTGDNAYDRFGTNICLSSDGSIVAVASRNGPNGEESGSITIYEWTGSSWIQKGSKINGDDINYYFGNSMSLSADGNIIAAGSVWGGPFESGMARILQWNGSEWIQKGSDLFGEVHGDMFGKSVSLSDDGNTIAVGARNYDETALEQGQVKVYSWSGTDWDQLGNSVVGLEEYGYLGWSVCLSADGESFITGAPGVQGQPTNKGLAKIFGWDGSSWEQMGSDIVGTAENNRSGWSVAMNSDGGMVLIGCPWFAGSSWGEGQLRIFTYGYVDIIEHDFGSSFQIYPNPATDYVNIDLDGVYHDVNITITNLSGQLISSFSYELIDVIRIDLEVPDGVYLIDVKTKAGKRALLKTIKGR